MKNLLLLFLLFSAGQNIFAQITSKPCNCCAAEYKQFDFWLGEWEVFNIKGEKVGENNILSLQDSCLIQENWASKKQTGTSYNYYNKTDSSWNQVYIDNLGMVLELKGAFKNDTMVLESKKVKGENGNFYFHRISWTKDISGNISQKWDIVNDNDSIVSIAFNGIYKLKTPLVKNKKR